MLNAGAWSLFGTPQPFLFQINGIQVPEVSTYAAAAFALAAVAWQGIRRAKSSR